MKVSVRFTRRPLYPFHPLDRKLGYSFFCFVKNIWDKNFEITDVNPNYVTKQSLVEAPYDSILNSTDIIYCTLICICAEV